MLWLLIIPGVIVVFIAILLIRAAAFKPPALQAPDVEEVAVDEAETAERLARMIRCKTVSSRNEQLVDKAEFEKFFDLLPELYPNVHKTCVVEKTEPCGLLYTLKGKSNAAPVVFMSHFDVVPADETAWQKPAFEGIIENDILWGRGTLDTKGTLCGIMEAAESLITQGFVPENDLYFAFSGDEEIAGETAPVMVGELRKRGIKPAMVLDEGGAIVEGIFPGVTQPCALIGTAEKGMLDAELIIETGGGHASAPPPHTSVGLLARAVTRIENKPFKARLTPPVAAMLDTLGRYSPIAYRIIFSNLWCFFPVLDVICRKQGGELNAMLRTTCAFTMMKGSNASNVLPPHATIGANLRIIGGETPDKAIEYMKSLADDSSIKFRTLYGMDPSKDSPADGDGWQALKNAILQTWPGVIVSPYLMFACSDSRHYCAICDRVYRFSAVMLSKEERSTIHGHNERIPLDSLARIVRFYTRLMSSC